MTRRYRPRQLWADYRKLSPLKKLGGLLMLLVATAGIAVTVLLTPDNDGDRDSRETESPSSAHSFEVLKRPGDQFSVHCPGEDCLRVELGKTHNSQGVLSQVLHLRGDAIRSEPIDHGGWIEVPLNPIVEATFGTSVVFRPSGVDIMLLLDRGTLISLDNGRAEYSIFVENPEANLLSVRTEVRRHPSGSARRGSEGAAQERFPPEWIERLGPTEDAR